MLKPVVNKVRCKKCNDVIESIHNHDLKTCKCGAIFIDGGMDYQRYGWGFSYLPGENESLEDYVDFSFSVYDNE